MRVISRMPFNSAAKDYPNQKQALEDLYRSLRQCKMKTPEEMRQLFSSLDNFKYKKKWWIIDIGGNKLRVIIFIQFILQRIYVKHILTHADYDKLCQRYAKGELQ